MARQGWPARVAHAADQRNAGQRVVAVLGTERDGHRSAIHHAR